jgi:hypothetical protein
MTKLLDPRDAYDADSGNEDAYEYLRERHLNVENSFHYLQDDADENDWLRHCREAHCAVDDYYQSLRYVQPISDEVSRHNRDRHALQLKSKSKQVRRTTNRQYRKNRIDDRYEG